MAKATDVEAVPIADIETPPSAYPREDTSHEHVALYQAAIESLPPILISHENVLIDGWHRLEAHRRSDRTTIRVSRKKIIREDILEEAIRLNSEHGYQLSMADKKKNANALVKAGREVKAIAELLSVERSTVAKWTRKAREESEEQQNARIRELWTACWKNEAIGEVVGLDGDTVGLRIREMGNIADFGFPESLAEYTIWDFAKADPNYGIEKYPGRMPGQIVENLLWYFTEPGDAIMDPFAGGCTTFDVCREMGRRCLSTDIRPNTGLLKKGIVAEHDVTAGLPKPPLNINRNGGIQLLLLDPPYARQKKGEYGGEDTNLANLDDEAFYGAMDVLFADGRKAVAKGGYLAVIVSASQKKGMTTDHTLRFAQMLSARDWEYVVRIMVPYQTQQYTGADVCAARKDKRILQLHRDLLIYRNE